MGWMVWFLWDLVAVAIIVSCVYRSALHGFLRTMIGFVGYFVATAVARLAGPLLAEKLYDHVVRDALVVGVNRKLEELVAQGQEAPVELLQLLPGLFRYFLSPSTGLESGLEPGLPGAETALEELIDLALRGPVLFLLEGILFFIIFGAALYLIRHFSRMFSGLNRVPVLGPLNTLMGGVMGLLEAVLFLFVGAFFLGIMIFVSQDSWPWLNADIMDNTFIWRVFYSQLF